MRGFIRLHDIILNSVFVMEYFITDNVLRGDVCIFYYWGFRLTLFSKK